MANITRKFYHEDRRLTGPLFKWNLSWIWRFVPGRLISLVRSSRLVQSREEWDDGKETNERRLVFFLCPIFPRTRFISASLLNTIEERSVTSHHHGSKISGSQQSFFAETAICVVERWKKRMGYRFVQSAIVHRKVIHVISFFFRFFLTYLQDRGLLISRNFATMVTWRNNLSSKKKKQERGLGTSQTLQSNRTICKNIKRRMILFDILSLHRVENKRLLIRPQGW